MAARDGRELTGTAMDGLNEQKQLGMGWNEQEQLGMCWTYSQEARDGRQLTGTSMVLLERTGTPRDGLELTGTARDGLKLTGTVRDELNRIEQLWMGWIFFLLSRQKLLLNLGEEKKT